MHQPARLTSVELGGVDSMGRPMRASCVTCHAQRQDAIVVESVEQLNQFHQSLSFSHGQLACASCHAQGQPPKLHLADGTLLETRDALQLCAQCHGTQYTDYQHGAHGGMTGHWDRRQGARLRNHCVDCHDPHSPSIKPVQPKPPPRDRFFNTGAEH